MAKVNRQDQYQQALDSKTVTAFYNKVTLDFVAKYGQDEPFNKEFAEDPLDPEEGGGFSDNDSDNILSKEEADQNAILFPKLRTKLTQWYRRKYKRLEATKTNLTETSNPFTAVLAANIEKAPRKLTPFHMYLKLHYKSRIKCKYVRRHMIARKSYENATREDLEAGLVKKPIPVQLRTEVGFEFWKLETEEFHQQIIQEAEDHHSKALEAWEQLKQVPRTPLQFHQQLAFAGQYLHPVAMAIAVQMQAAVSISIIGPVGERGDEVEVRSVHVNWPGGLESATWPLYDPVGYTEAEKSMCAYGRANFSATECRARALPTNTEPENETDAVLAVEPVQSTVPEVTDNRATNDTIIRPVPTLLSPSQPVVLMPLVMNGPERTPSTSPQPSPQLPDLLSLIPMPKSVDPTVEHPPHALLLTPPRLAAARLPESVERGTREESPVPRVWRRAVATPEPEAEPNLPESAAHESVHPSTPLVQPTHATDNVPHASLPNTTLVQPPVTNGAPDTSDWPQHMVDVNRYFTEETVDINDVEVVKAREWGDEWLECLREFTEFQRHTGFPDTGPSLPPAAGVRPPEIAIWMKNRRPWKDVEINKKTFGQQWWAWWFSLQPTSRTFKSENRLSLPTSGMDWSQLNKPGKNSFLLIMLALVWWGKASGRDGDWMKAVGDVSIVLRCMQNNTPAIKKAVQRGPLTNSTAANSASVTLKRRRGEDRAIVGLSQKKKHVGG